MSILLIALKEGNLFPRTVRHMPHRAGARIMTMTATA